MKLVIVLFFLFINPTHAEKIQEPGFFASPAFFYWSDSTDYQTKRARNYLLGTLTAGYKNNGLFIGGTYDYSTEKWVDSGGATEGDYIWTRTSWGPTVGLAYKQIFGFATYYYQSELKDKRPGASEITYKKGTGIQVTAGVQFELSESIYIAPQLSYRSFRYTESTQDGINTVLTRTFIKTAIDPLLAFFFYF